ncbi:CBS domain-containing protein [Streptomyces sp. NPDC048172]|uniref:CBS domain-containing protein n=1 Tax=Streptomyces sp. NPDC048172 TaxID=3365505 RepID=UPI003714BD77
MKHRRIDNVMTEAARTMARRSVERLPVTGQNGTLVGIVTRSDLLRVFLRGDEVVTLRGRLERRSEVPVAVRMAERDWTRTL